MLKQLLVAASLLMLATHGAASSEVDKGRAMLKEKCARCHAIGLSGKSPFEPAPPFRQVVHRYDPDVLAEAFAEGVITGHPAMPQFEFSTEQIDAMLAYLASLRASTNPAP